MSESPSRLFVAAYRGYYSNGKTFLQLVTPKGGLGFHIREEDLNNKGIQLGSFCTAKIGEHNSLTDYKHTTHREGVTFEVEGPRFAYATIEGELVNDSGKKIFKTAFFGKVVDLSQSTAPGIYKIKVHALEENESRGILSTFSWGATAIQAIGSSTVAQLKTQNQASTPPVHRGFVDATAASNSKKTLKALVTSTGGKSKDGNTKHFVWLLEEHKIGLASIPEIYEPGNVFEGNFKLFGTGDEAKWSCVKVKKVLRGYFTGRLSQGHIEVDVTVNSYVPAVGARKFPETFHSEFGIIVDNKGKLPTICNNKKIAIQQRKMDDGDFHWVVTKNY